MSLDFTAWDRFGFHLVNGLAGRWPLLDSAVSHAITNDLVKAGLLGACLTAAWCSREDATQTHRARKILLGTLIAAVLVVATTKLVSHAVISPRPYLRDASVYRLQGSTLEPYDRWDCRTPLDGRSRARVAAVEEGDIPPGDWGSFPSDHAGFFVVLSIGVLAAWRPAGLVALGWTLLVILGGKVFLGLHTPLEILAGILLAAVWWVLVQAVLHTRLGRGLDWCVDWCGRHNVLASAAFFLVAFEVACTLEHVDEMATAVGKHLMKFWA